MNVYEALRRMRLMSKDSIPFSIKFVSMNGTKGTSSGERYVSKCLLRTGLSKDKSDKHRSIVSYTDLEDDSSKAFYIALLTEFNNIPIQ